VRARDWQADSRKDPEELEREIDDTRAELRATLDALEERLSTEHLLEMTLGRVRQHGGEFATNLGNSVKQHPLPMLLTSVGIAWMMMTERRDGNGRTELEHYDEGRSRWSESADKARAGMAGVRDSVRQAREHIEHSKDSVTRAAQSLRSRTGRAASATRARLSSARSSADHMLQEQPLVLGALGIAAGAIIGAMLPASRVENRWIGSARDRALEGAKQAGRQRYGQLRERAHEAAEQARERIAADGHDEAGMRGDPGMHREARPEWESSYRSDYERPEDYNAAVERTTTERSYVSASDDERSTEKERTSRTPTESSPNLQRNPADQRRKRPSEQGVGRAHSDRGPLDPDSSPTSKTPPSI
jgi:ElaB/YqjD/DUF883 family membrane-anchored ribosome-binding protein